MEPSLHNSQLPTQPPAQPVKMPRHPAIRQIDQYFQYHNRLASFHDWPLEWEVDDAKPSPEALARAGFFSHHVAPHELDNVVCPYCKIFLDSWETGDNPMSEHKARSPQCDFVRGLARTAAAAAKAEGELPKTPTNKDLGPEGEVMATAKVVAKPSGRGAAKRDARGGSVGRARGRGRGRGSRSGRGGVTKQTGGRGNKAA